MDSDYIRQPSARQKIFCKESVTWFKVLTLRMCANDGIKMNGLKNCVLLLLLSAGVAFAKPTLFDLYVPTTEELQQADNDFNNKKYSQAYIQYHKFAKSGDKFAQYRLSFMLHKGLGIEKDPVQALAWAKLAIEDNTKYHQHYDLLLQNAEPNELEKLNEVFHEYRNKYSNLALAVDLRSRIRNTLPRCTGSRIPGNMQACLDSMPSCSMSVSGTHFRDLGDDCKKQVLLRQPENLQALQSKLREVNSFIELEILRVGNVTVKEVENIPHETEQNERDNDAEDDK